MSLVIKNLNKYYKKLHVLKNISFEIGKGEVVALIGQNGAGKTTTIKAILKFCNYTGEIKWNDDDIKVLMEKKRVGYSPEKLLFRSDITVAEYLSKICVLKNVEKISDEIEEILVKMSLDKKLESKISSLSKGMKRKLVFLQAIISRPDLLILDEPTDGLDPIARRDLLKLIKELSRAGTTVLVTSHLLYDIQYLCDKIIIMREGKILKKLEREDFANMDLYKKYYSLIKECEDNYDSRL